ncbi:MAG: TrkA C-terminal domain-containing protein, partial [Gaiellaceae bacterium]
IIPFADTSGGRDALLRSLILVGGLMLVLLAARSSWVDHKLTRLIAAALTRFTSIEARDYAALLNLSNGFTVAELHVDAGDWIARCTLEELHLHDEGVAVLGLQRGMSDAYVGVPIHGTPVLAGDTVVLYGKASRIAELDTRKAGPAGDAAHELAVTDHFENDGLDSTKDAAEMMQLAEMQRA